MSSWSSMQYNITRYFVDRYFECLKVKNYHEQHGLTNWWWKLSLNENENEYVFFLTGLSYQTVFNTISPISHFTHNVIYSGLGCL